METKLTEDERREYAIIKVAMVRHCTALYGDAEFMAQYTPRKAARLLKLIKRLREVVQHD